MEQHLDSTVNMASSPNTHASNTGVAVAPSTQDVASEQRRDSASNETVNLHQLPIPPASEPMQYRAIGLIKGTYIPSEEQFTRGMLTTENNQTIDAVLLGRVMSLVKKHVDLTAPHLWVVYPRTRPKDEHLHAQIVGIWEPEKLNRDSEDIEPSSESEDSLPESSDTESDMPADSASPVDSATSAVEPAVISDDANEIATSSDVSEDEPSGAAPDEAPETVVDEADETVTDDSVADADTDADTPSETSTDATSAQLLKPSRPRVSAEVAQSTVVPKKPAVPSQSAPAAPATASSVVPDMTDGYFSIRGEVIQFSPDDEQITVRIKQAKRKSAKAGDKKGDESKEFKLQLRGRLEGRVVGYFWDLHAQRDGNDLVVTDSTMIKMVPPQKNKRKKFGGRGGGGRGGPRRRDGGGRGDSRPMRSSGDRPTPAPRKGPAAKPVLKKSVAKDSDVSADA